MRYIKLSLLFITAILFISCGTHPYFRGELTGETIKKPTDMSDIHSAYAYFSTASQSLQSMSQKDEPLITNQGVKNNIVNGWKSIPTNYFPIKFSKQSLIDHSLAIDDNNCSKLLGSILAGLAIMDEYEKANELIMKYCKHPSKIASAYNFILQITDQDFSNKVRSNLSSCN